MANVFISHAGADKEWAYKIRGWLSEAGHHTFQYGHPDDGIPMGDDWQKRVFERLRWADAFVCVVTPSYVKSVWCAAEIGAARMQGPDILPVKASSERFSDHGLLGWSQYGNAARDEQDTRKRLLSRLTVIDGGGGRGWADNRSPYPGLRPFELDEHRVFFGREPEIKEIIKLLRSPTVRTAREILTIEGTSGCGKSSLVRAGVSPRIAEERYWLTLEPIVPESDPLGSLVRSMATLIRDRRIPDVDPNSLLKDIDREGLSAVATRLLIAAGADSECKLLIVIDQLEELLTQTERDEHKRALFVDTVEPALGGPVQVLATLRPEFRGPFSKDPHLSKLRLHSHQVKALDSKALEEVITGPAEVAGLRVSEDLVGTLITDTGSGDALPLLAFTLEKLARDLPKGGELSPQRYEDIRGVQGALIDHADTALQKALTTTGASEDQVVAALLNLVDIDEDGRVTKRHVGLDDLDPAALAQLKPFIAGRLVRTEPRRKQTFVAVSHEAFLTNWPKLNTAIADETEAIRERRVVEKLANDWIASGRHRGALLRGSQLGRALTNLRPLTKSDRRRAATQNRHE